MPQGAFLFLASLLLNQAPCQNAGDSNPAPPAEAQACPDGAVLELPAVPRTADYDAGKPTVVVVDKLNHTTHVMQLDGCEPVSVLSIANAVGKRSTPTPEGRTYVTAKRLDPVWTPPKSIDPRQRRVAPYSKTRRNPLGVAAVHTGKTGILLHGTKDPSSIGRSVSHGCVRHRNEDILKLYDMVEPGTAVYLSRQLAGTRLKVSDFIPSPSR